MLYICPKFCISISKGFRVTDSNRRGELGWSQFKNVHNSIKMYIKLRSLISAYCLIMLYTSRYLDDLLNNDTNFFDSMVNRIYPSELQLNKTNVSGTEALFSDLHLSISDGFVRTKFYDKRFKNRLHRYNNLSGNNNI